MRLSRGGRAGILLLVAASALAPPGPGAASAQAPPDRGAASASGDDLRGELTVSAASSLTDAFARIARDFRRAHPAARVRLNLASSSSLVAQIQAGAPVDVLAAADLASFDRLAASGHVTRAPTAFARNRMTIVVKPGNPRGVRGVADLSSVPVVALCARTAPCGLYGATVLARAGVALPETRITRGLDARATLAAVARGDADAGLVYVTDARAAGSSVTAVAIPAATNSVAVYGIGAIRGSPRRALAAAFIAHVLGPEGRAALVARGFERP